ncbi:hypothetical protein [Mucilaginibacter antarcticus]|uniref:hypothetical protein n=1 Tax=Mucilaginibacter antarcticus TaxID=1855725 RepID=UPI00364255B4
MIAQQLKTIDGTLSIQLPSQLQEVTLGQLMQMQQVNPLTDLDAISILSGTAVDDLKTLRILMTLMYLPKPCSRYQTR